MKPPRTWNPLLWHSMSFIAPNFPLVAVKHHLLHPRGHQRQHSSRPGSISPSALNQMFQGNSTCSYNTSYFASPIKCNSHTAPSKAAAAAAAALVSWTLDSSVYLTGLHVFCSLWNLFAEWKLDRLSCVVLKALSFQLRYHCEFTTVFFHSIDLYIKPRNRKVHNKTS